MTNSILKYYILSLFIYFLTLVDNNLINIIEKLEVKKRESDRFIDKYKTRNMPDLEEYYKGVSWALDYAIKIIKELPL